MLVFLTVLTIFVTFIFVRPHKTHIDVVFIGRGTLREIGLVNPENLLVCLISCFTSGEKIRCVSEDI